MPMTDASAIRRKIVGVLLQGARLKAGRTKKECADVVGVTPGVLAAYEEGRRDISLPELELLAYYMRVPVRSFLEGEDESLVTQESPPASPQVMSLRNRIIGALLREAREQRLKSQKDLARAMGCTPRRIAQYEHGLKPIPLTQLETAAEYIGVTLSHFLDEGIGTVGERELQDRQYDAFKALPDDVRAFVVRPVNVTFLRMAMHLADMPAGAIRTIAEGLLDITY